MYQRTDRRITVKRFEEYVCVGLVRAHAFKVIIPPEKRRRIDQQVKKLCSRKIKEHRYQIDHKRLGYRYTTGLLGEAALEEFLGVPIIEWEVGDSDTYNHPDIPNTKIGIKTVRYGKCPLIWQKNYYSQIICIISPYNENEVWICGLATKEILNKYQSREYVLNPEARKTAFYGFEHLLPVPSYEEMVGSYAAKKAS